jgi:soluble cytochrome b562
VIWLLKALGFARRAAQGAFGLIGRYPLQAALIVAVAAAVWLWTGKREALAQRDQATAGRASDRAAYTEAQRQAAILARQAREAQEARYKEQAERADHEHQIELATAMDRADAFIRANRVRATGAAASAAGSPGSAAESRGPESGNGPGGSAFLVAVTAEDVRVCTVNTTRLEAVREWALGL